MGRGAVAAAAAYPGLTLGGVERGGVGRGPAEGWRVIEI